MKSNRNATLTAIALLLSFATLAAAPAAAAAGKVNINTASIDQLALLPRVGPALAQRIVDFRKENGDFKAAADLMLVRGVGEKTFELMAPYLSVSGETTLSAKVSTGRKPAAAEAEEPKD